MRKALLLLALLYPAMAHAAVDIYIDSAWLGAHAGTQSQPYCSIYSAWGAINTARATQAVNVHFSGANPGGSANSIYTGNSAEGCSGGGDSSGKIDLSATYEFTFTLTLDGNSLYNTSEVTPNWVANGTGFHSQVGSIFSQNSGGIKYSNYIVDGFDIRADSGNKGISICGDDVIIRNNLLTNTVAGNQPTLLLVPNADSSHEGSSEPCQVMDNVKIYDNIVSPLDSEAIYLGGAACRHPDPTGLDDGSGATFTVSKAGGIYTSVTLVSAGSGYTAGQHLNVRGNSVGGSDDTNDVRIIISTVTGGGGVSTFTLEINNNASAGAGASPYVNKSATNNCQGFPSHTNIEVYGNRVTAPAMFSGENDGIDIKGGFVSLSVHDNYLFDLLTGVRCIVTQGANISDSAPTVKIYNNQCINGAYADGAITVSNTWGTARGISIFNNVMSGSIVVGGGVKVYDCTVPCLVANNTIYGMFGAAISVDAGSPTIKNNALLSNGSNSTSSGSFNAFSGSWAGCTPSCVSGLTSGAFVDVSMNNFLPASVASPVYHTATDLSGLGIAELDSDIDGTPRGSTWDIGAYQLTGSSCGTPSKLTFVSQPSSAAIGASLGPVSVAVKSASNITCTDSMAAIAIANTSMTCSGMTLGGTASGNATAGVFTSTNLTENAAGSCTLTATSSGLTSAVSNSFTVSAAPSPGGGLPVPFAPAQFWNTTGKGPASGYRICTYAAGTTKILPTYATVADATVGSNPIQPPRTLDDAGRIALFLGSQAYKFVLYTDTGKGNTCNGVKVGTAVWTADNIRTAISILTLDTLNADIANAAVVNADTIEATSLVSHNVSDPRLTTSRVVLAGTAGLLGGDGDLTFLGDTLTVAKVAASTSLTAAAVTDSALTSGRVLVASTAGLLADDADLTFSGDTLTATKLSTTELSRTSGDLTLKTATSGNVVLSPVAAATSRVTVNSRFEQGMGTTIVSSLCVAGDCIIPGNGNFFMISGTTAIDGLSTEGVQAGTEFTFKTLASITLTNAGTVVAGFAPMKLIAGADVAMTSNDIIRLVYDGAAFNQMTPVVVK